MFHFSFTCKQAQTQIVSGKHCLSLVMNGASKEHYCKPILYVTEVSAQQNEGHIQIMLEMNIITKDMVSTHTTAVRQIAASSL